MGFFRKRSGNGTMAPQYIYVLYNKPYWWVTKIGITGYPDRRIRGIREHDDALGKDYYLFKVHLFGAYYLEQFLHKIFAPFRVPWKGSGRTERFLIIVVPIAFLLIYLAKIIDIIKIPLLAIISMYLIYWLS